MRSLSRALANTTPLAEDAVIVPAEPPAGEGAPNCWQCRHFATSWDPKKPYACRAMGFKSRVLPCLEVMSVDGERCLSFEPKPAVSKSR
jgi:hypothetical protein